MYPKYRMTHTYRHIEGDVKRGPDLLTYGVEDFISVYIAYKLPLNILTCPHNNISYVLLKSIL